MRRLVVRRQAELEFAAAIDWYRDQNPAAARDFAAALDKLLTVIQENPFQYQAIEGEIRRALVPAFPYRLIYLVTEMDVAVVAFLHTSREPNIWRGRFR